MLTAAAPFLDSAHLLLSSSGRVVLTVAATLFLAYVVLMTTALVTAAVRGWFMALQPVRRLAYAHDRGGPRPRTSMAHMVEQS